MVERPSSRRATQLRLLNLGTVGFVVAWLAFASYAIAYLVSHYKTRPATTGGGIRQRCRQPTCPVKVDPRPFSYNRNQTGKNPTMRHSSVWRGE